MAEVDNRIVSMKFDNAQFEKGVSTSIKSIGDLNKALQFEGVGESFDKISRAANKIDFSGAEQNANNFFDNLSIKALAKIGIISNLMTDVYTKGKKLINDIFVAPRKDGFNEYELKMGSVQTIMASTGATLKEVNSYLEELNEYADRTIYSFSDMTASIGKFTNAGVSLDKAVAAIKGISNEAAVSGANSNEASRAMYNFAQALSAGYVKLIDWKSIENANMATVEFKQQLIDSAVALGTVVKEGNKYRSTTTDLNNKVSELFDSTSMFNDSLSAQWMTTDVLVKTLGEYADETTTIGKKAYAAAQEVKTWSQLMDTVKEAIGSGWAQSFEIIIGDFNEAKDLFTAVNSLLDHMVSVVSGVRNGLLQIWKNNGGRQKLVDSIKELSTNLERASDVAAKALLGKSYDKILGKNSESVDELSKSVENYTEAEKEAARNIWYGPNVYGNGEERIKNLTEAGLNVEHVQAYVEELIKSGRTLTDEEELAKNTLEEIKDKAEEVTEELKEGKWSRAFDNLVNSAKLFGKAIGNIGGAIVNVGKTILEAFGKNVEIDEMTHDIRSFARGLVQLTGKLKRVTKDNQQLKDVITVIVKALNNLWIVLSTVGGFALKALKKIILFTLSINDNVKKLKSSMEEYISTLDKESIVYKAWNKSSEIIAKIKECYNDLKKVIIDIFNGNYDGKIKELGDSIKAFFTNTKKNNSFVTNFKNIIGDVFDVIKKVWNFIKPVLGAVWESIKKTADELGGIDLTNILEVIKQGGLIWLLKELIDLIRDLTGKKNGFKEMFESIGDTLNNFLNSFKYSSLKSVAISLGLLALSLFALSKISKEGLNNAFSGMAIAMGSFLGFIVVLTKFIDKDMLKNIARISSSLISLSLSILIISSAIKVLSAIPILNLIKGLAALSVVILALSIFMNKTNLYKMGIKSGIGIIGMATGLLLLVGSIKLLSMFDLPSLAQGLLGVTTILAAVSYLSNNINPKGIVSLGLSLIPLSIGLGIISTSVAALSFISIEKLGSGILAIISLLGAISYISNSSIGINPMFGVSMTIVSGALVVMAGAIIMLSKLKLEQVVISLGALAGALTLLIIVSHAATTGIAGTGALLVMSLGILALSSAIKVLSTLNLNQMCIALATLAGTFIILALAGAALTPLIPSLAALGGAMIVLGAGGALVGAGLLLIGIGIGALSEGLLIFVNSIKDMVVKLSNGISDIILIAEKLVIAFATGILKALPTLLEMIGEVIIKVLDFLAYKTPMIISKLYDLVYYLIVGLADTIESNSGRFAKSFMRIILALKAELIDSLIVAFGDIPLIGDALNDLSDTIHEQYKDLKYEEEKVEAGSALTRSLKNATKDLKSTGEESSEAYISPWQDKLNKLPTVVKDSTSSLDISKTVSEIGSGNLEAYVNASTGEFDPNIFSEMGTEGANALSLTDAFSKAGITNTSAYSEEIENFYPQSKAEGAKMTEEGADGAESNVYLYKKSGYNAVHGFIMEIYNRLHEARNAGAELAKATDEGVRGELEIHSPSRVMMENGMYIVKGLVNGIAKFASGAEQTTSEMGDGVLNSFMSPLQKIVDLVNGTLEYDPTIRPVLDTSQLMADVNNVNSMFGSRSINLAGRNSQLNMVGKDLTFNTDNQNQNQDVVDAIGELRNDFNVMSEKLDNIQVVMDSGALVGAIAGPMDTALGRRQIYKGRRN